MTQTTSITLYEKWDIVLVNFPFTNLTSIKKRPSLIISPDEYNKHDDVIITFITSNIPEQLNYGDFSIRDWKGAGLYKPTIIKMKFATITKSIITKKLGSLKEKDKIEFSKKLMEFFRGDYGESK